MLFRGRSVPEVNANGVVSTDALGRHRRGGFLGQQGGFFEGSCGERSTQIGGSQGLPSTRMPQAEYSAIATKFVVVNRDVAALGAGRNSGIHAYFHSCSPAAQYCDSAVSRFSGPVSWDSLSRDSCILDGGAWIAIVIAEYFWLLLAVLFIV